METVTINGVDYVGYPDKWNNGCEQCALRDTHDCPDGYDAGCSDKEVIWLRKDSVRQQVEVNKAFGHQLPLFPEIEPQVTAEEDEAFAALEKKKQVGGDHYLKAIQPWDIIRAWDLNYWEGNIVKYTLRHKGKGKIEDLEKAKHYLEYLIEHYDELF